MKKAFILAISAALTLGLIPNASAHAGVDTRGVTPTKAVSSVILLRIGHGCTAPDGVTKVGTHSVSVVIPSELLAAPASAAMQIPGWNAVVVPSAEKNAAGIPASNTITWTAKSDLFDVNPVGFAEFGIRGAWANSGKFNLDTTQICRLATATPVAARVKTMIDPKTKQKVKTWVPASVKNVYSELKLVWNLHDGSAGGMSADMKTETGPAPTVTIS